MFAGNHQRMDLKGKLLRTWSLMYQSIGHMGKPGNFDKMTCMTKLPTLDYIGTLTIIIC